MVGGAWVWVTVVARSIRLTRRPEFWRASVGDIFKEQYEIENRSRLPGGWVELYNEMPIPMAAGSRLLTRLFPGENQTYVARTWLTQRGGFPVGPTLLTVADPLGLYRVPEAISSAEDTGGAADDLSDRAVPFATGLSPGRPGDPAQGDGNHSACGGRSSVRARGIRMRRIHWPTTARRGQLIVKEFEQDPQAEVWIFLDAQERAQAQKDL